jgi:hypothetical protein
MSFQRPFHEQTQLFELRPCADDPHPAAGERGRAHERLQALFRREPPHVDECIARREVRRVTLGSHEVRDVAESRLVEAPFDELLDVKAARRDEEPYPLVRSQQSMKQRFDEHDAT